MIGDSFSHILPHVQERRIQPSIKKRTHTHTHGEGGWILTTNNMLQLDYWIKLPSWLLFQVLPFQWM